MRWSNENRDGMGKGFRDVYVYIDVDACARNEGNETTGS